MAFSCKAAGPPCNTASAVKKISNGASVTLSSPEPIELSGAGLQLGFNLEWRTFQTDFWSGTEKKIDSRLLQRLNELPGFVYRYPGGSVSNYSNLAESLGDHAQRRPQQAVRWGGPVAMDFGLKEYFAFLEEVKGQPWLVVNLFGDLDGRHPVERLVPVWARILDSVPSNQRPLRWELGNELYLQQYELSVEDYVQRAKAARRSISEKFGSSAFVAVLSDFNTSMHKKETFNRFVAKQLASPLQEYAQHSYYDGPPGGPSIPNRIREICKTIEQLRRDGTRYPVIWVTEHARWPGGKVSDADWRSLWWKTNNMEAALGVADYLLAVSQIPEVRGAFLHSLAGMSGPWALFSPGPDGEPIPTAVFQALKVMSKLQSVHVLATTSASSNLGEYVGGYDVRSLIASEPDRTGYSVFAVNRSGQPVSLRISMPPLAGSSLDGEVQRVAARSLNANNTTNDRTAVRFSRSTAEIVFDRSGVSTLTLDPFSVTVASFAKR